VQGEDFFVKRTKLGRANIHAAHIRAVQVCGTPDDYPIANKHRTDEESVCLPTAGFTAPGCTISAHRWLYSSGPIAAPITHDDLTSNMKVGHDRTNEKQYTKMRDVEQPEG
jgi:hypothetical protein